METTTPDVTNMKQEIDKRRKLEEQKDKLATKVRTLVDKYSSNQGRLLPKRSQLQNLRTIVAGTDSVEEVKIYIVYQTVRQPSPIPEQFGKELIKEMPTSMPELRLFFGFLRRYAWQFAGRG